MTSPLPRPLPLSAVRVDDPFWTPRQDTVRTVTLPQQQEKLEEGGQFRALRLAGTPDAQLPEDFTPHVFWESDVGKWIEAASYSLARHPDPDLESQVDSVIALLAAAQQPDGYLNSYFTLVDPSRRFTDLRDAHELYCLGHLIEGAVAHHEATGRTTFLDVVTRFADLVDRELSPGGAIEGGYCGHPEVELALIKLADATGEDRYRDMVRTMVDARGTRPFYYEAEAARRGDEGYFGDLFPERPQQAERFRQYNQSHLPVRAQDEAVGHSVRAMYLYSAMADLAASDGDAALLEACRRLWTSATEQKMYVTGGIGSDPSIEGFGSAWYLPNDENYNETCASIGLVMWARRMAHATGRAEYFDVLEQALYNTVLAGVSAEGTGYFYGNPMQSDGEHERSPWFGVACCPPNLARLIMSLGSYAFAAEADSAYVQLYVSGEATFPLERGRTRLQVRTGYPYEGQVRVTALDAGQYTLALRVPGWADGATVRVNGQAGATDEQVAAASADGYVRITRNWVEGDEVVLELPLGVRRVHADQRVEADRGKVALQRGPLVYCAEGVDNPGLDLATVTVPAQAEVTTSEGAFLGAPELQVAAVVGTGVAGTAVTGTDVSGTGAGDARTGTPDPLRLVPYFAWANRGTGSMRVWLDESAG
jgi:DUF1680 family protein